MLPIISEHLSETFSCEMDEYQVGFRGSNASGGRIVLLPRRGMGLCWREKENTG